MSRSESGRRSFPTSDIRATVIDPWVSTRDGGGVESTMVISGDVKAKKKKKKKKRWRWQLSGS